MKKFRFGLIGNNVTYSKSADIFKAVFKQHDIDGSCEVFNICPDEFNQKFQSITGSAVDGLSVTIPYKKSVISFLDEIAPVAHAIEAVNSIRLIDGKRFGYNTDCFGFSYPLRQFSEKLKHGKALIFGAGGAAKAALYALFTDYEIKDFVIVTRDEKKIQLFKESIPSDLKGLHIRGFTFDNYTKVERYAICVNCTPLGGWNMSDVMPFPSKCDMRTIKIYYDLNYNADNKCMEFVQSKTQHSLDGSAMLVAQALRSFYLWTGIKTEFEPIYKQVFGA